MPRVTVNKDSLAVTPLPTPTPCARNSCSRSRCPTSR